MRAEIAARTLPCAALMVGDSRHDVDAARAAGVRVIGVAGGYNHGEDIRCEAPDLVVDGLGELL
jgi:phosphoglycolate phosphatase